MNRDTRRTRVLLALLLVTSVSLITLDYRGGDQSPLGGLRSLAATVFGPVEQVSAAIVGPVADAVDGISGLGDGRDEARRLRRENAELLRRLRTAEIDRTRVAELDALLGVAGAGRYKVVPAQVIAIGAAQTLLVDRDHRRRNPRRRPPRHDGPQRRRPRRAGQDGRRRARRRCCSRSTPSPPSASGSRARWRWASRRARGSPTARP